MSKKEKSSRTYRDSILKALCKNQRRAIELINALTGANYSEDAKIKFPDLDNSLLWRYNDVALEIEGQLVVLIEGQSTISPNMPLRFLSYVVDILYSSYVKMDELYGSKIYKIPTPKFYVLYNGDAPLKEDVLKLSNAFEVSDEAPGLELTVQVFNVNHGSGSILLEKSELIAGYSYLIGLIRRYMQADNSRDRAIRLAIETCIAEGVLVDFLKENYEEVIQMLDIQYNQEAEFRILKEEAKAEGLAEGLAEGEARGEAKGKAETAKKMKEQNFPYSLISDLTDLPESVIASL